MTNRQKYILNCDDDGHWYFFPIEKKEDFQQWVEIQYSEDYDNPIYGSYPDWLKDVGGHPNTLTFENPEPLE